MFHNFFCLLVRDVALYEYIVTLFWESQPPHKAAGIANSQWCRAPEEDQPPALPIDYNQCENTSQLIHVDINGGMTSQLNKILKVAIWAARDNSCFYIDEEKVGGNV